MNAVKTDEVLIKIEAPAVNRGDSLQRIGKSIYPSPMDGSPYPVLNAPPFKCSCRLRALLNGGGYAEKVAVPAGQVLPVPSGISLKDAAAFPEVACTVWSTVFMMSRLSEGEIFLIRGGSKRNGTFAIQIAKYQGSEEKLVACKELGADVCINYKTEDFVARVKEETGSKDLLFF
ncbi:quinone oxidoreductase, putative [Ricinus communis]|uniref:Quinone oxidoreductase, putative n=1 Tax=Ricinus communis TaxID=3988 RepID=B9S607_RICCO|nr:quinone oxidoreductase, putative [Ricinus communis]